MQSSKDAREARRKRLLERGSDRLAYIAGDASKQQSLKSSVIPPSQGPSFSADVRSIGSEVSAEKARSGFDGSRIVEDSEQQVPDSQAAGVNVEPLGMMPAPVSSNIPLEEPLVTASFSASTSSDLLQTRRASKKSYTTYVKNIVHSIEVSEGLRALAAALVAVLVVTESFLSCCGHRWGDNLAVFLPRWPLILVFITHLTLVIGAFVIQSQNKFFQKALGVSSPSDGLDASFDKISKALDVVGQFEGLLDLGSLCKKAVGAISLDCSIYAVTLVCGFSIGNSMFSCCKGY